MPSANCRQAAPGKSSILIVNSASPTDQLKWSWKKGQLTLKSDFGNPAAGIPHYELCVYDASANPQPVMEAPIAGGGMCGAKPCWKETRIGYTYTSMSGNGAGITKVNLKSADAGKAAVQVQGNGTNLTPPPLALTLPVAVQLLADNGSSTVCWQTRYTIASTNNAQTFKARGP